MNPRHYIHELETNSKVFQRLLNPSTEEAKIWKQHHSEKSMHEIICHLHDAERENFRARLNIVLKDPSKPFPHITPESWVAERKYHEKDFKVMLNSFLQERTNSVEWLTFLKSPKWDNTLDHPTLGPISAKFILSNWVAHDYLHIRQITKLKYDYLKEYSNESLHYSGSW